MTHSRKPSAPLGPLLVLGLAAGLAAGQPAGPLSGPGSPREFGDSRDRVVVRVAPERTRVTAGDHLAVAVIFDHERGWHVHTNDPQVPPELGEASDYYATVIEAEVPRGSPLKPHARFIQWPQPKEIRVAWLGEPVPYRVFEGRAVAYLPVTVDPGAPPGRAVLRVKPAFQACDESTCLLPTPYPPREPTEPAAQEWLEYGHEVALEIVTPERAQSALEVDQDVFGDFDPGVWERIVEGREYVDLDLFGILHVRLEVSSALGMVLLLAVAAVGGFLLNLTPCVLPVIPIKIMSLAGSAGDRARTLFLGTVMSAGVVSFWLGLGAAIASIGAFSATNQLFQYPVFTIGVGVVIALLAVGMCGVFSLRLPQALYMVSPRLDSVAGAFLFGVMVAVLSTPCTAPFMGAAVAWASLQEPATTLTTFAAIGAGMALPYQVLATFPGLVERMPRTGPASVVIKQVMGLLMLAAAAYFVGVGVSGLVVASPDPPTRAYWWFVAGFGTAAGAWLAYRSFRITRSWVRRAAFGGLGAAIAVVSAGIGLRLTNSGPIDWVYYTPQRLEEALDAGNVVVVEFTAEWCLNCHALEQGVLHRPELVEVLGGPGVVPMKVDLTGNNAAGNEMLTRVVGRRTIPLLVVFAPDRTEVFKQDFYTASQVLNAVREARSRTAAAGPAAGTTPAGAG